MRFASAPKFFHLNTSEKIAFIEALILLVFAKLLIFFVPLRKAAPFLGKLNYPIRDTLTNKEYLHSILVKEALSRARNTIPWQSVCLDHSLAAIIMLRRRYVPFKLCFGVKKGNTGSKIEAHAWVISGSRILVGGTQRSSQYTTVAYFSKSY
jgi:hypothetical protein